ncbi:MAG: ArsJ-associated glyceraldehyde-3-phosphate dehydrogenase [Solirubrobacterales bacterium]|nr:ArsJ-associated glyceraldehyde-3-phosphate dehydrogenase [Solirubrobacterales bacterium]
MSRKLRVGINGFGRMGRLALRAGWDADELDFVQINEIAGGPESAAHLLEFDSVHGRWRQGEIEALESSIQVAGTELTYSSGDRPEAVDWCAEGVDLVIEATGKFRTPDLLAPHFDRGAHSVLVAAPVKEQGLNIVYGVNDSDYDPGRNRIVTAASCTTNCLAPVVKVIHEQIGIRHGSITTLHDLTNTQVVVDAHHKDLRRARSAGTSLIPTSTGSATAIGMIFPDLVGRLDGLAVRVPLLNSSITDCCFEVDRSTSVEEVNGLLRDAARNELEGILGFETRPLVSVDFKGDPRSGIVDGTSTRVIDETQVKILAFYDNEWGYANRMIDIARMIARASTRD